MTKTFKWLGGGIAAAMLLGLAGLFSGEVAEAQPSGPPHRFAGSVTLDGEAAAAGTSVTAFVNGAECGSSATVITTAAGSTYAVDVPDSCADAGDTVSFQVGGYDAAETGTWGGGGRTDLDLSASSMMPEDPMEECPEEGMDGDMNGDAPAEPSEPSEPEAPAEPAEAGEDASEGDMPEGDMPEGDMPEGDMGEGDMDEDCPEDDMTPEDTDDPVEPTDDPVEPTGDPDKDTEVGDVGTGLATTSTSSSLAALLGVTALAIVLGGYTVARRRR